MSEYESPFGNESWFARAFRTVAFFTAGLALLDLAADQLAKALGAFFVEKITGKEVTTDAA